MSAAKDVVARLKAWADEGLKILREVERVDDFVTPFTGTKGAMVAGIIHGAVAVASAADTALTEAAQVTQ